jgi:hypothetical protein
MKTAVKHLELWSGRLHKSLTIASIVTPDSVDRVTNGPFLEALLDLAGTPSNHGTPVDDLVLQVAFVAHIYSYTVYEFPLRYLPPPSRTTIYDHFVQKIKTQEQSLRNPEFIAEIVKGHRCVPSVTLAINVCATDSVFIGNRVVPQDQPSNKFTIEVLPLSPHGKCFPASVMPAATGHAGREQKALLQQIVEVLGKLEPPVHVMFIATDGYTGYKAEYEAQFSQWYPGDRNSGLGACLNVLSRAAFLYGRFPSCREECSNSVHQICDLDAIKGWIHCVLVAQDE